MPVRALGRRIPLGLRSPRDPVTYPEERRAVAQHNLGSRARQLPLRAILLATLLLATLLLATGAAAEPQRLRSATQLGLTNLPPMVMEHERLVEKHARAAGLGDVAVTWARL